jgi:hypothetical protein
MKKKILALVCCFALFANMAVSISAQEDLASSEVTTRDVVRRQAPEGVVQPTFAEIRATYLFDGFDALGIHFLDQEMVTSSTVRRVRTTQPLDRSWRNRYPSSYMWESHRTVIRASEFLNTNFAISLYSGSQRYWNHNLNGSNSTTLLNDAIRQHGLWDNAALMIAFTDLPLDGGNTMGLVSAIGARYGLVTCYGFDENAMTTRHEVGHMYNLSHCASGTNCFMSAAAPLSTFNQICATHRTQFNNNRLRY